MSAFAEKLDRGRFVVTAELNPPKGVNLDTLLETAALLAPWIDAANLTDSHTAKMTMSPLAPAVRLGAVGLEAILQITGRDRNRIAIQGDLLAASALGIGNVVCMSGDNPGAGDHPDAKGVFDLDAVALLETVRALNSGHDLAGNALSGATALCAGAVANPGAADLDAEIARLGRKVEAGARFVQTQPVYDLGDFEPFAARCAQYDVAVLAGIIPLKSVAMAKHLNAHVPGIRVPDAVIARLSSAADAQAESLAIAADTIGRLRDVCAGVHVMAIGWERHVPRLLEKAGLGRKS